MKMNNFFDRMMGPQTVIAKPEFRNRWAMAVPAFATHLCIGSPWAWSVMSGPVSQELGFVSPAAGDWSFSEVTLPMSIVFALQGLSAAAAAKWQTKVGARTAMATAGCCFGGGLMLGGLGVATHNLPLVYMGYGFLGGCGVGVAYTPPVQALIEWFPDRKGIASGLTIAGFGSGALVFAPVSQWLSKQFAVMPQYLGPKKSVDITSQDGKLFADVGGTMKEVVLATKADIAALPYDLAEGVYVVGTGATGVAPTLGIMGAAYLAIMTASAFAIRRPAPGYKPDGWEPPVHVAEVTTEENRGSGNGSGNGNVHFDQVLKTPQFYQLGATFFFVGCGGMGLFSVAKPMMSQVFSSSLPAIVTSAFASSYVLALSAGNLTGRIGWAAVSDKIGRRAVFNIFTWGSIPLYLSIPFLVDSVVESSSPVPLYAFMGTTVAAISCMGGVYAILPAYEADLFGSKYVGPIHGRVLLASTAAAMAGPTTLLWLRSNAEKTAIHELLTQTDPGLFLESFKVPITKAEDLIQSKQLTIPKLMELVPEGTPDPSPFLYHSTMYTMAGFMCLAALSHNMVKKVDNKHFEGYKKR